MTQTLYATYDGHVLIPEGKVDLLPNERYLIRIEADPDREKNRLFGIWKDHDGTRNVNGYVRDLRG
ncbi:hypothetical protein EPICR_50124 [Candidatus Desulfarcum epimagneticum]|uniref:DUF104 domain-containing protein n=1 Tax=uncultured Desulfobacteraceae bacterium TaxID=218296 RepID=A0A484HKV2_9BACT|nr:hypothetical protein EPICR_50124 [uncultured Desulfobacteraceae bacterium]